MTDRPPLLDIFVPYWGDPTLLFETVASLSAQTSDRWRAVVVDDCYPDLTVRDHFAREDHPRISYVRNATNLGTTGNYDRCRGLASAELVMFMGCDDLVEPDFVARVVADHEAFPDAAMIQPGVRVIDESGAAAQPLADRVKRAIRPRVEQPTQLGGEALAVSLLRGDWLYWPALVFRTAAIRDVPFHDDLPIIQDLAFVIDLIAAGETLVFDPVETFSYRRHLASASATSILGGTRLSDERRYYASAVAQMRELGWHRARRTASVRWTSRLHGLALLPSALRRRRWTALVPLLRHAMAR
ncbi:glycosyltransferase [Oryzobacter telluris]|uniref:glycosyltransferase n=1 Tax=Oryzobacter telluris TaxID=3149179 RepID=UPI00370D4DEF